MAYDFNQVTILGRLSRDPETHTTPNGMAICNFAIATNPGKEDEGASFFDCKAFDAKALVIQKHCTKGKPIIVVGKLKQEKWQDKTTGENRSKTVILVSDISFLPLPPKRDGDDGGTPARARRDDYYTPSGGSADTSGGLPDDDDIPF
jgi:single-strand DNA-binding protein